MRPARAEPVQSSMSSEWVLGHRILGEMGREGVGLRQLEFCRGPTEGVDILQTTLMFLSRCSLTSPEVRSHYLSGGPEAHESTGIIFVETQVWSWGLLGVWLWGQGYLGDVEGSRVSQSFQRHKVWLLPKGKFLPKVRDSLRELRGSNSRHRESLYEEGLTSGSH